MRRRRRRRRRRRTVPSSSLYYFPHLPIPCLLQMERMNVYDTNQKSQGLHNEQAMAVRAKEVSTYKDIAALFEFGYWMEMNSITIAQAKLILSMRVTLNSNALKRGQTPSAKPAVKAERKKQKIEDVTEEAPPIMEAEPVVVQSWSEYKSTLLEYKKKIMTAQEGEQASAMNVRRLLGPTFEFWKGTMMDEMHDAWNKTKEVMTPAELWCGAGICFWSTKPWAYQPDEGISIAAVRAHFRLPIGFIQFLVGKSPSRPNPMTSVQINTKSQKKWRAMVSVLSLEVKHTHSPSVEWHRQTARWAEDVFTSPQNVKCDPELPMIDCNNDVLAMKVLNYHFHLAFLTEFVVAVVVCLA